MEYLLKILLIDEDCNDLYSFLVNDNVLANVIKICRSIDCKKGLEFFLQVGSDRIDNINKSYIDLFPLALIIAISLGIPYINRVSHRFSKHYIEYYLNNISEVEFIERIRDLGLEIERSDECFSESDLYIAKNNAIVRICYKYRIHFISYLKAVQNLSSTEILWGLPTAYLYRGYVLIENREKVARIFMEYLRNSISNRIKAISMTCNDTSDLLSNLIKRISSIDQELGNDISSFIKSLNSNNLVVDNKVLKLSKDVQYIDNLSVMNIAEVFKDVKSLVPFSENFFPPCIQSILKALIAGENLTHHQRFALATFLINLNINIDEILNIFRHSPDFNEKIARYQLEHLAGLRGSKRRYLPYNCQTMKTLGMCNNECNVKNPLHYTNRKLRSSKQS
jgi:DNA primase large subunit